MTSPRPFRKSTYFPVVYDDSSFQDNVIFTCMIWEKKTFKDDNLRSLEAFVGRKMGDRGPVQYVTRMSGSYNQVLQFRIDDGQEPAEVALRLPRPGWSSGALMSEKLENEVYCLQYFEEEHIAPVPHVYSWRASKYRRKKDNGIWDNVGPYILMDFVPRSCLHTCMQDWKKSDDPEDAKKCERVYEQLATFALNISRPRFDKIGAIRKGADGRWAVTQRPLTYDMHAQLTGMPDAATQGWPEGPLKTAEEYKALTAYIRNEQMWRLRNINLPGTWSSFRKFVPQKGNDINMALAREIARGRVISRTAMAHPTMAAHLHDDGRPFALANPDYALRDFLVDPETARITAILDLEFTNAMPAAFSQDPPLWLTTNNIGTYLTLASFPLWLERYEADLNAFLDVLRRVERETESSSTLAEQQPLLSERMRASWESKKFLVHLALDMSEYSDMIYYEDPSIFPAVDAADLEEEIRAYQEHTEKQIVAYDQGDVTDT